MLREFIASQFRKPSGLFGIFTSNVMIKGNQTKYERLIKDLDVQPNDQILEIGYGPGMGIKMILESCPSCTVHGIDFSKLMNKKAGRYNRQYVHSGRAQLQYGDFLKLPVAINTYDKVFCINVIYFWEDLAAPFEKVCSILKKGGAFHIYMADESFLNKNKAPEGVFNKYSLGHVIEALKSAGFQSVESYFEKGHYIKAYK
jgi:ubiquinone/menaquinone biosynthesis C-methylase UbiE